ncbi:hypothetical protein GBA52_016166 [Prunus armeniaca]|nr:hypothetical protein GBA52_016166 [Prunus armeniaca]
MTLAEYVAGALTGSCWAFATTAAVEALHALTFELQHPPMLSVQQLIDCNTANYGCGGGSVSDAFAYIISNGGLNTEQNYPYQGIQRTCDTVKEKGDGLEIDAYAVVNPRNEDQLAYALCEQPSCLMSST